MPFNEVVDGVYYNCSGESIAIGQLIDLSFAGSPCNCLYPYTLVNAWNFFSTVGYKNEVRLLVSGANNVCVELSFARYYNPRPFNPDRWGG